ncbi:cobyrinic acid a,c-diamide synthase [Peptostreptococcaceae bacterium pGA-8]|nr:cobyrinic acid a,c-diamide synthase [Peptostreptococcaceae bacterium pGA-8]
MKNLKIPRVMICGTASGSGKTTVTLAILSAVKSMDKKVAAFKCGPDYIDPMFHSKVLGIRSRNLDLFLCGYDMVKNLLGENSKSSEIAVIEGVMGIYDGIGFRDDSYSANHIAKITDTPEVMVVSVKGMGRSIVAAIKGYLDLHENNLKGVILNNCSKGMYKIYKTIIEEDLNIRCFGYLPSFPEATIGSRHLGLITADEIVDIKERIKTLGEKALESIDFKGLFEIAEEADELTYDEPVISPVTVKKPRIAVAYDKAFNFYYEDNIELLQKLGADIIKFSPINDMHLPKDINGLIFGGGYPEEYLDDLMNNGSMKEDIKSAYNKGIPVYAECGGFMYLAESITKDGKKYPGVGIVSGNSHMTKSLVRFGYKTLRAEKDNFMCKAGEEIKCHEFHYSETDDYGNGFKAIRPSGSAMETIHIHKNLWAGYPHVHWYSNIGVAENFVKACGVAEAWK